MTGIKDLDNLLKEMKPVLKEGEFVFCTVSDIHENLEPIMTFKENEGTTLILKKSIADEHSLAYEGVWCMISLSVHSDLAAVGFLARISNALAEAGICSNVVSAYYHDHLFLPIDKKDQAMEVLLSLSR